MATRGVSETAAWHRVLSGCQAILRFLPVNARLFTTDDLHNVAGEARHLEGLAGQMLNQVSQGIHENPPLVIFANPRRGMRHNPLPGNTIRADEKLSNHVYELAYCHVDDGRDYKHKFAAGTQLYTGTMNGQRVVVLVRRDGKPLWDDFD